MFCVVTGQLETEKIQHYKTQHYETQHSTLMILYLGPPILPQDLGILPLPEGIPLKTLPLHPPDLGPLPLPQGNLTVTSAGKHGGGGGGERGSNIGSTPVGGVS